MVRITVEIEERGHGIATKIFGQGEQSTGVESAVANLVTKEVENIIGAMNEDDSLIERELMNMAKENMRQVLDKFNGDNGDEDEDDGTKSFIQSLMQAMMLGGAMPVDDDEITEDECVDEPVHASWVKEELAKIAQED